MAKQLLNHNGLADKATLPKVEGSSLAQNIRGLLAGKEHKTKSPAITRGQRLHE